MQSEPPMECEVRVNAQTQRRFRYLLWISIALIAAAGFLGFVGWIPGLQTCNCSVDCKSQGIYDATLRTLRLFVLNNNPSELCNWVTQLTALLAPFATVTTIISYFSARLARRYRTFIHRTNPPDVVFLGGGKSATSIAMRLLKFDGRSNPGNRKRKDAVFVDRDVTPLVNSYCSLLDCTVSEWRGSVLSKSTLYSVNALSAQEVWVATGDDRRNIEVAQRLAELRIEAHRKPRGMPQYGMIYVSVYDQELIRNLPAVLENKHNVRFFSINRLAARKLLRNFPPKLPPLDPRTKRPLHALHIAIIGEDEFVEAIVEQAVVQLIISEHPADALHISVIAENASSLVKRLGRHIPQLDDFSGDASMSPLLPLVNFHALDTSPAQMKRLDWQQLQKDNGIFARVYVSGVSDLTTFSWVLRAATLRELNNATDSQPITACLSQAEHEHGAMDMQEMNTKLTSIDQFRIYDCIVANEHYPGEQSDAEAKLINYAYMRFDSAAFSRLGDELETLANKAWIGDGPKAPALPEAFRQSSRLAADHINVKLACVYPEAAANGEKPLREAALADANSGLLTKPATTTADELSDNTKMMTRLEHRRFVVERLVSGWLPCDVVPEGNERAERIKYNKSLKLNETLVPFVELSDTEQKKDQMIVECIPAILQMRNRQDRQAEATSDDNTQDRR